MTIISLALPSVDVFQILDALDSRATSWEYTAGLLDGNLESDSEFRVPEECDSAEEAAKIAKHFRDIGMIIRKQIEPQ